MTTPLPIKRYNESSEIGLIQGIRPDSINEWWFGLACERLKLDYNYQVPIGTIGVRGSQWVDYVVYSPFAYACFIQGSYWHSARTETEDRLKHAAAERVFGAGRVVDFSEEETASLDAAIRSIRRKLL